MHLVLLHGYLLQGTGSNIYVASVARAWCAQGHAVTILCQDPHAATLPFVDESFAPEDPLPETPPDAGRLRVIVPEIEGLLPVYVLDRYEGYAVKRVADMTAAEIERHVTLTAAALRETAAIGVDRVLANHVLLGPLIARRALEGTGIPYDVKIHGSAVEYALVPSPHLMPYAVEGLRDAERIYVGSRYVRDRMLEVFASHPAKLALDRKLHIVSPGMDPTLFTPSDDVTASEHRLLAAVRTRQEQNDAGRRSRLVAWPTDQPVGDLHARLVAAGETYDQRAPDADLLERWPALRPDEPIIAYCGKFLDTKGVGELLVTFPTVLARLPQARLLLIGFGAYREHLEGMIQALRAGDAAAFAAYARAGAFVQDLDFSRWFRSLSGPECARITITGMLDHDCLREILPLASVSVVPSKWPEAFGMVAVEAMAAGVLPLCNYHAGLRDVVDAIGATHGELAEHMILPAARLVDALPDRICAALEFLYPDGFSDHAHRRAVGRQLRELSVQRFSWDRIARRLIDPQGDAERPPGGSRLPATGPHDETTRTG